MTGVNVSDNMAGLILRQVQFSTLNSKGSPVLNLLRGFYSCSIMMRCRQTEVADIITKYHFGFHGWQLKNKNYIFYFQVTPSAPN
jgi:hypothetical protein